jgi:AraC family transcriptional activator of mtrCDE
MAGRNFISSRGEAALERPGLGELTLDAGDILLLPHGDSHVVRSKAKGVSRPIASDYRNGVRDKATSAWRRTPNCSVGA